MAALSWCMRFFPLLSLGALVACEQNQSQPLIDPTGQLSIGIITFPGFEPLDIMGPLEILYQLSYTHNMTLAVISHKAGPVSAIIPPHYMGPGMIMDAKHMVAPTMLATHAFADAPANLDVLLVPGGMGLDVLGQNGDTAVEDFIRSRIASTRYLLSVCTGSQGLAKAGALEGRRATSNKKAFRSVSRYGTNVTWVPTARWVEDGNVWTSSGVAAGMDMTYAFLRRLYGDKDQDLTDVMNLIEYAPHTDPHWDPFSVVHQVPGADTSAPLDGVTRPVGF